MKVIIAITGSTRDKQQLDMAIDGAIKAQRSCPIVQEVRLSTTDDQNSVRNAMKKWAGADKLRVIQAEPPTIVVKGHRLHQLVQLQNALAELDPDVWVLKLRTDKLILPPEMITACITNVENDQERYAGKFGIVEGHVFLPWFINDMAFFGQVKVLKEIVSFDVSADLFAPGVATEQAIWAQLLGHRSRAFFDAAHRFPQTCNLHPEELGILNTNMAFEEISEFIYEYWSILSARFFSITDHRFKEPKPLQLGGIEILSDRIFTRYGTWGSSFTDPSLFASLPQDLNQGARYS